jgi:glycosyltransferase involved in cell wall biosynthesis
MLNRENRENIMITFCGTVYNSAKYIEKSLKSIIDTAIKLKTYGVESEIVIVDNYSDDGTWELLQAIREKYNAEGVEMKFIKYKCSRGLGRNIALKIARGRYLFI